MVVWPNQLVGNVAEIARCPLFKLFSGWIGFDGSHCFYKSTGSTYRVCVRVRVCDDIEKFSLFKFRSVLKLCVVGDKNASTTSRWIEEAWSKCTNLSRCFAWPVPSWTIWWRQSITKRIDTSVWFSILPEFSTVCIATHCSIVWHYGWHWTTIWRIR